MSSTNHCSVKPRRGECIWILTMKYFIIISLASLALGDKLENVYLPPHAGSSSGANAGLQAPIGGFGGQSYQGSYDQGNQYQESQSYSQGSQNQAQILKYENVQDENGYRYAFETSDGTKAEQQGNVIPGAAPEEGSLQVQGSYSYIGDDGQTYEVTYTADENGYQARGAHLPTPPPIPEEILKSLQLTAGNQYDNQRNSYDADRNGY